MFSKKPHSTLINHNFGDITLYQDDLPDDFIMQTNCVAIDTEATGLHLQRDRLCLVQLSFGDGKAYLVQTKPDNKTTPAPNLCKMFGDEKIEKIFHFGRFDIAMIHQYFGVLCKNVYCTKIAAFLAMTYTEKHGLKELCRQFLEIEISKAEQSSYWGQTLTQAQKRYAAHDVFHLHGLKSKLNKILQNENRYELLQPCLDFLPHRALLDCNGWTYDIFAHLSNQ
jgi:ribonuclease D